MRRTTWHYRIHFIFLFSLALLCWSLSGNAYRELQKQLPTTAFQNVGGLLAGDYEPMRRSEAQAKAPLDFILWTQMDNQPVEGLGTGRTETVSWIAVKGDTRLLLPVMQTLDEEDTTGCLIDKGTAKKLFGDPNAIGGIVKMGGVEYTVRGVIDSPARTVVSQRAGENSMTLSNITVSGTDNTDTFLLRHGLSTAVTVKSSLYLSLARILCLLPIFAVLLVGLMLLGELRSRWKSYHIRHLLVSVGMLAVATVGLLLLITTVPEALIPSQWSDFGFWETTGEEFVRSVSDFIYAAKYRPDLPRVYGVFQAALGIVSANFILCLYNLFRFYRHKRDIILLSEMVAAPLQFEPMNKSGQAMLDAD